MNIYRVTMDSEKSDEYCDVWTIEARPMHPDWVRSVRNQCQQAGVPFFFKQWGGTHKKIAGRILDGRTWDEYPVYLNT